MEERAIDDFQRGIRRWTSKGDNIRGTLECCEVVLEREIRWFGSSKDFISKRT